MGISILAWLSSLDPYSWANMGRGMITMPMWKCPFINLYLYNYIQYHYMVKPRILLFKSLVKRNCTQNGTESKITNFFVFALTNNQSLTGTGLWSGQTAQHYRLWNKNKNWLDYSYKMHNNMSEWRDRCTCRLSFQLSL